MKKQSTYLSILSSIFYLLSSQVPKIANAQGNPGETPAVSSLFFNTEVNKVTEFFRLSDVINKLLPYLLTGAGLILFGMLIMGGFDMLLAASDAKKVEAGKARITSALTGFIIIFAAYWITQILEVILGISIFSAPNY